jgi:hypothetical protein
MEIAHHSDDNWRTKNPAINVKVYNLPTIEQVVERFKCDKNDAERALEFAWENAQESFWNGIEMTAQDIFGSRVKVYSEGRSSGWLTVHNLPPVEEWDGDLLAKWQEFDSLVKSEIAHLTSFETMAEDIESNRWTEPMSEKYNFFTTESGKDVCVAEINQKLAKYKEELLK